MPQENSRLRFAVIGDPIEHSLSPALHEAVFELANINASYEKLHIASDALESFVREPKTAGGQPLDGYNVTIPHKERIVSFLDEVRGDALLAGAVNTVVCEGEKNIGYNTDMEGLLAALKALGTEYMGRTVSIFGMGGAARGVLCKAASEGAKEIRIFGRNAAKAENFIGNTQAKFFTELSAENIAGTDIFINATPLGMAGYPHDFANFDFLQGLSKNALVYDLVYTPATIALTKAAKEKGIKAANGLSMLVYQGIYSEILFGELEKDTLLQHEAYKTAYNKLEKLLEEK